MALPSTRTGPALGRAQDDHGPTWTGLETEGAGVVLDALDVSDHGVERGGHELVHLCRIVALDEIGRIAIAAEQGFQFVARDAGQHRGAGDLVAVQMQDGQYGAVMDRIEKLVRVPARGERPGLRLAVADHAGNDQVRIVEGRTVSVRQRITQLAALVDRPGCLGRDMTGDAARKRELLEQPLHSLLVLSDVQIDLAIGALQIGVRY